MREREERSVTDSDVKWQNHNRLTLRKKKIISGKKIIYFNKPKRYIFYYRQI